MMPIDTIPDWEARIARQDAFWQRQILDRPVVCIALPKTVPVRPQPAPKPWATVRDRWMDTDWIVESALAQTANTEYLGDALPIAWPNLGPELFSAFFGMEMEYTEDTSWGVPILEDWRDAGQLTFSEDNVYWKKLVEITHALLDAGKGKYYVGLTDFHPGGDALAAFRDPMQLNLDMLDHVDDIIPFLDRINETFFEVFAFFYHRLRDAGQAITSWPGIVSSRKWYVPSNDFSCMISKEMFDRVFLPGIVNECRQLEASIYHLDGPAALRHLDSLLAIDELNAIQWVYGAGHGRASDWLGIYRRCQDAGKGIQLFIEPSELDLITTNLRPEGVWMSVNASTREEADAVLHAIAKWT